MNTEKTKLLFERAAKVIDDSRQLVKEMKAAVRESDELLAQAARNDRSLQAVWVHPASSPQPSAVPSAYRPVQLAHKTSIPWGMCGALLVAVLLPLAYWLLTAPGESQGRSST